MLPCGPHSRQRRVEAEGRAMWYLDIPAVWSIHIFVSVEASCENYRGIEMVIVPTPAFLALLAALRTWAGLRKVFAPMLATQSPRESWSRGLGHLHRLCLSWALVRTIAGSRW